MSQRLATATLELVLDDSKFDAKSTTQKTSALKSQFDSLGYSTEGVTGSLKSMVGGFITANLAADAIVGTIKAGFGAAIDVIKSVTTEAANYGDSIRDASIQTGLSTQTMSAMKLMAQQSGASIEDVSSGLKFLSKNFIEATNGGKQQIEAFDSIGISARDLKNAHGDLDAVMRLVMDRFSEMPDGAAKTTAELALLGKGGVALTEMFSQGSSALEDYSNLTSILGTETTPEAAAASDAFNDSLDMLDEATLGLSVSVGTELLPMLTQAVQISTAGIVTAKDYAVGLIEISKAAAEVAKVYFGGSGLNAAMQGVIALFPGTSKLVVDVTTNYYKLKEATGQTTEAADHLRKMFLDSQAPMESDRKAKEAAAKATEKLAKEIEEFKNQASDSTTKQKAFIAALHDLDSEGKLTAKTIREFKDKIVDLKDSQDPLIKRLNEQILLTSAARAATDSMTASLDAANKMMSEMIKESMDPYLNQVNQTGYAVLQQAAAQAILNTTTRGFPTKEELQIEGLIAALHDNTNTALNLEEVNRKLAESMGAPMWSEAIVWADKNAKAHQDASESMQRSYETAIGNITTSFSQNLIHFDWSGMKDGVKKAGEDMLAALVTGFINPIMTKIGSLGASLASALFGGGGFGGSGGGGIGGFGGIGGIIGGIFGGAGAGAGAGAATLPTILMPNGAIIPGMTVGGAGGGAAGAGGFLGTLGSIAPFAAAAVGPLMGLLSLKFSANDVADVWVNKVQNPFGESLKQLVDGFDKAKADGTLTPEMAAQALKAVNDLWALYSQKEDAFVPKTRTVLGINTGQLLTPEERLRTWQGIVVTQSHATLDPLMKRIFADLMSVPSLDVGAPYIPHDTFAYLHEGEAVLTKEENAMRLWGGSEALGSKLDRIAELITAGKEVVLNLDGRTVARGLVPHFYSGTRNENWVLIGSR